MKVTLYFLLLFIFSIPFFSDAQSFLIWEHSYGGSNFDQPFGSEPTDDGGIVLGGHSISNDGDITSNYGDYDWWVFKIDATGKIVWNRSYGGSLYDKCRYATENPDGTYLAFGSVMSNDSDVWGNHNPGVNDYWLLKLDAVGNIIWKKCYGGTQEEGGRSVIRTYDGSYLMAGYSISVDGDVTDHMGNYDVWLVKVEPDSGSIIWAKSYGGSKEERVRSIYQWPDSNFVFTGNTDSQNYDLTGTTTHGGEDLYVSRIDQDGNVIWAVQYGGPGEDRAYYCTRDRDGNVLVAGRDSGNTGDVTNNHGRADVWVLKLNYSDGSLIWQKSFGGTGDDEGFRIDPTDDGGYMIGATTESSDGDSPGCRGFSDFWFIKVDSALNIQWTRTDGGPGFDHLNDMIINKDGSFTGIGFSGSNESASSEVTGNHGSVDTWLVKVAYCDSAIATIPAGIITLSNGNDVVLKAPAAESYIWSTGETSQSIKVSAPGNYNVTISKVNGLCIRTSLPTTVIINDFLKIFPNPAKDKIDLSLIMNYGTNAIFVIYNTLGEKVLQHDFSLSTGDNWCETDISMLKLGMYFITVKNDLGIITEGKFVKAKE